MLRIPPSEFADERNDAAPRTRLTGEQPQTDDVMRMRAPDQPISDGTQLTRDAATRAEDINALLANNGLEPGDVSKLLRYYALRSKQRSSHGALESCKLMGMLLILRPRRNCKTRQEPQDQSNCRRTRKFLLHDTDGRRLMCTLPI